MIAKAIPMKTAVKSHFAKLVTYITDDQDTPFRLGAVTVTNCYGDEVEDAVFEVLNTQLKNQRAISDKTYHLIVSFRAGDMEAHAGIESLITWIQQNALAQVKQANSWEALHMVLYENGLSIKPRGNGLAISTIDGAIGVKASSVDRELSKGKLEQRLGSFQAINEQTLATTKV